MAHAYLESMKEDSDNGDSQDEDEDDLSGRLRRDRLESQGMYYR
jgi:hypothetical protein